jgi:hypothetical protein
MPKANPENVLKSRANQELKRILAEGGITSYQIRKETGLHSTSLDRYRDTPEVDTQLSTAEFLADLHGYELRFVKR